MLLSMYTCQDIIATCDSIRWSCNHDNDACSHMGSIEDTIAMYLPICTVEPLIKDTPKEDNLCKG